MRNVPTYNSLNSDDIDSFNFVENQLDFVNTCVSFVNTQIDILLSDRHLDDTAYEIYYKDIKDSFAELKLTDENFINNFYFDSDLEKEFMNAVYNNNSNSYILGKAFFIQSAIQGLEFTRNFAKYTKVDNIFCHLNTLGIQYPLSVDFDNYNKLLNTSLEYYIKFEYYREAAQLKKVSEKYKQLTDYYETLLEQVKS